MRRWTNAEETILADNKEKLTAREIGKKIDRSEKAVWDHAGRINISLAKDSEHHPKRKYHINHNFFKDYPYKGYYWAGFLFADGNVAKDSNLIQIGLNEKDKTHLEKFKKDLGANYPIRKIKNGKVRLTFTSQKIIDDLFHVGVIPQKSKMNVRPQVPLQYVREFIRGLFDGDGSIYNKDDPCVEIDNSKRTCLWLKNKVAQNISIGGTINQHSCSAKTYRWQIWGKNQIRKFAKWLYKDSELYMDRKYNRYVSYGLIEGGG